MVSECANPKCRTPFRFLHSGRIFRFDFPIEEITEYHQDILWDANGIPRRTELFWLCEACAREYTLVLQHGTTRVALQPLKAERGRAQTP